MDASIVTALITGSVTSLGTILGFIATNKKNKAEQDETHKKQLEQLRDSLEKRMDADKEDARRGMDAINAHIKEYADYFAEMKAQTQTYQAVVEEKINELSRRVELHNKVVERTYGLEEKTSVHDEKIKVANNRIKDLERLLAKDD